MSSLEPVIRKLFNECETDDDVVAANLGVRYVMEHCESKNTFTKHESDLFAFVKSQTESGIDFIRMVCLVKLGKKKVDNVSNIMAVIRCVEQVLIFIDSCEATESEGFMYLDMVKELKPNK